MEIWKKMLVGVFFLNTVYMWSSVPFDIANGTKQGCVLVPLLFCIFLMMLLVAFKHCDVGIPIRLRTDMAVSSTCVAPYKLARRHSLQWFVNLSMPMTMHWWHIHRQTPISSSAGSWMPLPALAWQSAWGRQKSCYNQSTVSHPCRLLS